jgi:hypothetical protein
MENKVSNLIKNVLEENAVKFKEHTSEILYSKVSNRLKQQYVEVSKNLFKNINENVRSPEYMVEPEMSAPPPGKNEEKPPKEKPKWPDPGPPPRNPYPDGPGPQPERKNFPKGSEGDQLFLEAMRAWRGRIADIAEYKKKLNEWWIAYRHWREHDPTQGPDAPRDAPGQRK